MKNKRICKVLSCLAIVVLLVPLSVISAAAYDVPIKNSQDGTPVPDVDKPVADMSCWLATAANVLGAGGWGAGPNAQAKANNIYTNQLIPHFGNGNLTGWSSVAINWWLMNHGYNPASADYDATIDYTDVTHIVGVGAPGVYDFILRELRDCQYVNVAVMPETGEVGHEMTLVGGDWSGTPGSQSVWHDNNGDFPAAVNAEPAPNVFAGGAWTSIIHRGGIMYTPEDATLLCPGLRKPDDAVQNFDVAYFKDMRADGSLYNNWRHAGDNSGAYRNASGSPYAEWLDDFQVDIPNLPMPEPWYKEVYLLVDYIDRNVLQANPNIANVQLNVGGQLIPWDTLTWDDDGGQALFTWILDELVGQPPNEILVFPHMSYKQLYDISTGMGGPVKDWNVATICIPEPATTVMILSSLLGLFIVSARRGRN